MHALFGGLVAALVVGLGALLSAWRWIEAHAELVVLVLIWARLNGAVISIERLIEHVDQLRKRQ